jgi:hypothetical protein
MVKQKAMKSRFNPIVNDIWKEHATGYDWRVAARVSGKAGERIGIICIQRSEKRLLDIDNMKLNFEYTGKQWIDTNIKEELR